ncbi:MAG: hypothetical protein Q9M36_08330 [Sulfurovum sp.]|nr:hypothetical protein [Sulfurovum sp.]
MDIEHEIMKIRTSDRKVFAKVLSCCNSQVTKYKNGSTAVSIDKAFRLEKEMGLSPRAFAVLRQRYLDKRIKELKNDK